MCLTASTLKPATPSSTSLLRYATTLPRTDGLPRSKSSSCTRRQLRTCSQSMHQSIIINRLIRKANKLYKLNKLQLPGADPGLHNSRCPMHQWSTEVERRRHRGGWSLEGGCAPFPKNFGISYIKMVSFYAFPEIFIDIVLFKKAT